MIDSQARPYRRSKLGSKLTPQFSFEKFTVLMVSKLGSKLILFFSTLNSTLSSKLSSKLRPNFELNFDHKVVFKVGSRMGQVGRTSQILHSDTNDTRNRHNIDTQTIYTFSTQTSTTTTTTTMNDDIAFCRQRQHNQLVTKF
jgi:hypothetical protein